MPDLLVGFISGAFVVLVLWVLRAFYGWRSAVKDAGDPERERWNDSA